MRNYILVLAIFALSCGKKTVAETNGNTASFITVLHKENATKDGIYLNHFVVDISYDSILKLDGKKIRVSGKYVIAEGLNPNDSIKKQGRYGDTKHINHPKIDIINEAD